jgi:uncharacterized DUF497 family protein
LRIEWDPAKAKANRRKHDIDFADAAAVLFDELALTIKDAESEQERYITVGADALARTLVVVFAWTEEGVRLISARKGTKKERQQYEDKP